MDRVSKIGLTAIFIVVLIVLSYALFLLTMTWPVSEISINKAAEFGDSFGVLTSTFSGLAFAGVVWTLLSQREELKVTRDELKKQRFDNSFFQMLGLHNDILGSIDLVNRETAVVSKGRDCFITFRARLLRAYEAPTLNFLEDISEEDRLKSAYKKFWKEGNNELGHYFRFLFNLYRFIDESTNVDKKFYSNLVRSQLSDQELFLLFYNCLTPHGQKFMTYAIQYELFDNLKIESLMSPSHVNLVDSRVFGREP
jgi:hypothetical protein